MSFLDIAKTLPNLLHGVAHLLGSFLEGIWRVLLFGVGDGFIDVVHLGFDLLDMLAILAGFLWIGFVFAGLLDGLKRCICMFFGRVILEGLDSTCG